MTFISIFLISLVSYGIGVFIGIYFENQVIKERYYLIKKNSLTVSVNIEV